MVATALVASVVGLGAGTATAQTDPPPCPDPAIRTWDRTLDVWFGTLTVIEDGQPMSTADFVELDKPIAAGFALQMQADTAVDARVKAALRQWVAAGTEVEWALGPEDGTDAQQALIAAFTGAGSAAGPGSLAVGTATPSMARYHGGSFESVETAPVLIGDMDAPTLCGGDGQSVTVTENFEADVTFHELNATYTLGLSADELCRQLVHDVTNSAKYQSAHHGKRLVPNALMAGACIAIKLIKPDTSAGHKHWLKGIFKGKVDLLRGGGWLTAQQAATLKDLADSL
jgi:hypothetical protein